ncbi:MAG: hypothetical protein ACK5IM_06545 [Demequina sp.]|uniref:hypothetical protein n=1 Tax=Demequina sp. TaxID=2050685 RepID=UPI003A871055
MLLAACSGTSEGMVTQSAQPAITTSTSSTGSAPSSSPQTTIDVDAIKSDSICGLGGVVDDVGTVLEAFEVEQTYLGTTNLFTSAEYGPGAKDPSGFYYCFQHTPEGAVMAAMAAMTQAEALTGEALNHWDAYSIGPGPDYEEALAQDNDTSDTSDVRPSIRGFRVLQYDGSRALIDVAAEVATAADVSTVSVTVPLVWDEGDWKIYSDASLVSNTSLTSLSGYILPIVSTEK